ncbi:MAG: hypothetical protein AB1611_07675, partial [bacterium]
MNDPLATTARVFKRVTLDDIYSAIDEVKHRQEESSRYFNQRLDTMNQRIDNLGQRIDNLSSQLNQKIDSQIVQINQKIDS